ncbi:MAG: hypothetical protein JKY61_01800 [Planctomycetes bacterium]|nr:hypothetical protein [Planctomycetota bacterium]
MGNAEHMTGKRRQGLGKRTCLYCFQAFRIERGKVPCPACGEEQSKLQQDRFWTLQPLWVKRQVLARGVAVALLLALGGFLAVQVGDDGVSLFWGLGLLVGAGAFLWETAGLLTRRESALPLRILWPAILLCIGFGPILFSVMLHFISGEAQAGLRWQIGLLWGVPWLVPFGLSLWVPGWLRRQREACLHGTGPH